MKFKHSDVKIKNTGVFAANEYSAVMIQRVLQEYYSESIYLLDESAQCPFFARCDFKSDQYGDDSYYIGKCTIYDAKNSIRL